MIESQAFKNCILSLYSKPVEFSSFVDPNNYEFVYFEDNSDVRGNLFINNLPYLEELRLEFPMFNFVQSVTICDNPVMNAITINLAIEYSREIYNMFISARKLTIKDKIISSVLCTSSLSDFN